MRTFHLLLERKPADNYQKQAHKGRVAVAESDRRWCSTASSSAVTMAKSYG